MKTLREWQKALAKAASRKFPNSKKWSQEERTLSILRQLADMSGAIQAERRTYITTRPEHTDGDHRVAALVADILLLCEQRKLNLDKELRSVLKWYETRQK